MRAEVRPGNLRRSMQAYRKPSRAQPEARRQGGFPPALVQAYTRPPCLAHFEQCLGLSARSKSEPGNSQEFLAVSPDPQRAKLLVLDNGGPNQAQRGPHNRF